MENNFLLSLCIPTYNRGRILDLSLSKIKEQLNTVSEPIELIVSDNCSPDDTQAIVKKYIDQGLAIRYIRNSVNLGMDGNFVQCFREAKGKYVWLLGDDDILFDNSLSLIIDILKEDTYGLLHLQIGSPKKELFSIETDSQKFFSEVSFWITFISSNIVNTKYVPQIDFNKYLGTYFTLVPLYMTAALSENKNVMMHQGVFEVGLDSQSNGGYNYFEVFVTNYLNIWHEFVDKGLLTENSYRKEKHSLYKNFVIGYIFRLLIKKDIGNFKTNGAWKILFSTYGLYPYFYGGIFIFCLKVFIKKIVK
ncbi:glycosyltransferase family 2 protein [Viscerimonas tarda]